MAITAAYRDWLIDPVNNEHRVLLIEADHATGTVNMATLPYCSETGVPYDAWLPDMPVLDSTLFDHVAAGSFTAINNLNPDVWQSYNFTGQECRWLLGDLRWNRGQFQPVTTAILGDVSRDEFTFGFDLVDKGFLLEKEIQLNTSGTEDKQVTIPITLGSVFNVQPVLIDYGQQIYQIHDGLVEALTVRDNGVPVQFTPMLAIGQFKLKNRPVGTVTCDVQQANDSVLSMAQFIADKAGMGQVQQYGLAAWQRIAKLGIQIRNTISYARILDELAAAVGGWWRLDGLGRIEFVSDQQAALDLTLTEDDIIDLTPGSEQRPYNRIKLHYAPNATVLDEAVLEGPLEAGVISRTMHQRLINEGSTLEQPTQAITGLFEATLEQSTLIADADDTAQLMALLKQRYGRSHRSYTSTDHNC
ncbi:MAG: hypothetical protein R3F02_18785 [Thiolinea sp.]